MSKNPVAHWAKPGIQVLGAFLLAALVWLAVPQAARADWSVVGDTVPAGQVIDNDVWARGTDVVVDGTINGDLLAIGSTVTVNGSVAGSLVTVGRTVTVNGEVGGSVYVLSRTLKLGSAADVQHNVHFLGLLLDSQSGSRIGRDLVAASVRGRVSSEIGRTLNALILVLTFDGRIGGGVNATGDTPAAGALLPAQLDPGGTLFFVGSSGGKLLGFAAPALRLLSLQEDGAAAVDLSTPQADAGSVAGIPEWLVARLGDLAVLLLIGGLAIWLRPALIERPADALRRKPLPAAGFGLLALIIAVNAGAIAILLAALLLIVGLWLGAVTLWTVAFLLWGIGYPALILALALFALTVLYGSKAIVADMVGRMLLKRLAPQALEYRILPMLLGLVLYVILRSIPYLGWAVEVVVTVFGLGAIWVVLRRRHRAAAEPGPEEEYASVAVAATVGAGVSNLGQE
jgi:hypothetical protein